MGWLNKKITQSEFTLMLVRFTLDFEQIYKILDELLPDSLSKFKKEDRAVTEILIMRAFIMTALTNSLIEKKIAKQVLDTFHDIIFSSIEDSDLKIGTKGFPQLLNDRYGEYYQFLGEFLGSKADNNEGKNEDKDSDSSFMFGTKIAAHIINIKEDGISELCRIDIRLTTNCYIHFMSLYKAELEVFAGLKDRIIAGK